MNGLTSMISPHRALLRRMGLTLEDECPFVLVTPRFRSSRNVVFLAFDSRTCEPTLVVKLSRNGDWGGFLAREAASLRAVHRVRPGGFDSVPRLVCHEMRRGEHLLVQTALPGPVMRPSVVRRNFYYSLDLGLHWLQTFHRDTCTPDAWDREAFMRLVELPLRQLEALVQHDARAGELLARTREAGETLRDMPLPLVFEHGDFGSPNLILTGPNQLGVIDWELAQPFGLPVVDVFFFLSFVSCARRHATTPEACAAAFREAFVDDDAWGRSIVWRYASNLGVPVEALSPLLLMCWARYLATLAARSECAGEALSSNNALEWLEGERQWAQWQCAVEQAGRLNWTRTRKG